jgi:hypothetical protein
MKIRARSSKSYLGKFEKPNSHNSTPVDFYVVSIICDVAFLVKNSKGCGAVSRCEKWCEFVVVIILSVQAYVDIGRVCDA